MTRIATLLALFLATSAQAEPDCGIYTYKAEIVRVIDGDTVVADIDLGFDVWLRNEHLRMFEIQAPERGTEAYETSREALERRVMDQPVYLCTVRMKRRDREATGTFGRYLVTVYVGDEDINAWMVSEGHAEAYEHR